MKLIPKGELIDDPYHLIMTDFLISEDILNILNTTDISVYFTKLSIKHLAEKGDSGEYIFRHIKKILKSPDRIFSGNFSNRFLISKKIDFELKLRAHVITIEVTKNLGNIIVTGFVSKESYFKNLKLLWGTASSPSQQP